jgi:putative RecB family exonuclease
MPKPYSISKIGTFETCRLQYKLRYIDEVETDSDTVEAFMGSRVHEALEELYRHVKNAVVRPKDWLFEVYETAWLKNWHPGVKIVRPEFTADDYRRKGRRALDEYYDAYVPFDQSKVVGLEEKVFFTVRDGPDEFPFVGVIDRLAWNPAEKRYEIHDYKTSGSLMTQDEADEDRQLALYQLALVKKDPEFATAGLVWHFLLFNKEVRSRRTSAEFEALEKDIAGQIREIEAATHPRDFPPRKSALCEWCAYEAICPLWKHPRAMEKADVNAYLADPGVKLVARYAELEAEKREFLDRVESIEAEQAKVEEGVLAYADREDTRLIDGPDHQILIHIRDELSVPLKRDDPGRWELLRRAIKEANRFEEVATINGAMLNARIRNWPRPLQEKIRDLLGIRTTRKIELKEKRK